MPDFFTTDRLAVALAAAVQLVFFLRWLYRHIRTEELVRAFVQDMATNHLPHMYAALRALCQAQGLEVPEPPPIRWIDLNGKRKSR